MNKFNAENKLCLKSSYMYVVFHVDVGNAPFSADMRELLGLEASDAMFLLKLAFVGEVALIYHPVCVYPTVDCCLYFTLEREFSKFSVICGLKSGYIARILFNNWYRFILWCPSYDETIFYFQVYYAGVL